MRSEYGKFLRNLVAAERKLQAPEFRPRKGDPNPMFSGERSYCYEKHDVCWLWLTVLPSPKEESFTLELGWSKQQRYPQNLGSVGALEPSKALGQPEYLCRIGRLTEAYDVWWDIDGFLRTPEGKHILGEIPGALQSNPRTRVHISVISALRLFLKVGIPFLKNADA